jgi:hypothetical protein
MHCSFVSSCPVPRTLAWWSINDGLCSLAHCLLVLRCFGDRRINGTLTCLALLHKCPFLKGNGVTLTLTSGIAVTFTLATDCSHPMVFKGSCSILAITCESTNGNLFFGGRPVHIRVQWTAYLTIAEAIATIPTVTVGTTAMVH